MKENWIIPCNIKYFDVITYLQSHENIVFRRISAINKGDVAYIYVTSPYCEIKYRCHVVCDDVSSEELKDHLYAIPQTKNDYKKKRYIKLHVDYKYEHGTMGLKDLKNHGLGQVQMQARTDKYVQAYINEVEEKLCIGSESWQN